MAKKTTNSQLIDNTPDYLAKPRATFEKEILERIEIGEEFLQRKIVDNKLLYDSITDFKFWHSFNSEFLNTAFNKLNNRFYKEYVRTPSIIVSSAFPSSPTFEDRVSDHKNDINKFLSRLKMIKEKSILIQELPNLNPMQSEVSDLTEILSTLDKIFLRFHKAAQSLRYRHSNRETILINDEYDVQDLLRSLLHIHFDDIREEDYSPSYAGGNSRVDFVLKNEKIVIETKITSDKIKDKQIGDQIAIDIARYRGHPDCKILVAFVYDKLDNIRNKEGLKNDLEKLSVESFNIKVYIEPK